MPDSLHNVVLSGADYAAAATIKDVWGGNGGAFDIQGGQVYYRLQFATPAPMGRRPGSGYGTPQWTNEQPLNPGPGSIPAGVTGVQFRNADAASPATVSAAIAPPNQPVLSLSGAGSVTTTPSSSGVISGYVTAAGGVSYGSGFTVTKGAAGLYTINFTAAFASVPDVFVQPVGADIVGAVTAAPTVSAASVRMSIQTTNTATDNDFMFQAFVPQ